MADVTARWPVAVGVSVAVHAAIALALLAFLGRAVAPESKPVLQKPTVVEVFRVGSLMPRAGKSGPAPTIAPNPGAPRPSPRPVARVEQPAPQADQPLDEGSEPALPDTAASGDGSPTSSETPSTTGGEGGTGTEAGAGNGTGATPGAGAGTDQLDPSVAAEVHARLARAASDCYPAQARRFRQQGQVPVSFCVEGAGSASKVVVTSSGAALLDEAARGCVMQRAEPFPAAAAGSCFAVKVEFGSAGVRVSR